MDMDTMILESKEREFKSMNLLLAHYQEEINELKSGTGKAATMTQAELWKAEEELESKISKLSEDILRFEAANAYIM